MNRNVKQQLHTGNILPDVFVSFQYPQIYRTITITEGDWENTLTRLPGMK